MVPWQQELIAQVRAYLLQYAGVFYADHGDPTFHQVSQCGEKLAYQTSLRPRRRSPSRRDS